MSFLKKNYENNKNQKNQNVCKSIVSHLLDVGWNVDHLYLEAQVKNRYRDYDNDEKKMMTRLTWGKLNNYYYLISNCNKYTARISELNGEVNFYERFPEKKELIELNIEDITLCKDGIKIGFIKIVLDNPTSEKKDNGWDDLEIYPGPFGYQTKRV